jgi:hypothetical protein
MGKPSDRNKEIMHDMWGTKKLVTDYDSIEEQNLLIEINYDNHVKKHNFKSQSEIHEKIRNENDYDDWEYGTEPIPLNKW